MGRWFRLARLLACALLISAGATEVLAEGPRVEEVRLRRGPQSDLLVDFRVTGATEPRVAETLDIGLPVRFTYSVRVIRPTEFWRDPVVAERRVVRTLEKDNLKDRYHVTFDGEGREEDAPTLDDAVALMARVEGVSVLPLDALTASPPLRLRIRAQLQQFQLPFRLHHLLPFVSYWDVETPWAERDIPADPEALK